MYLYSFLVSSQTNQNDHHERPSSLTDISYPTTEFAGDQGEKLYRLKDIAGAIVSMLTV